MGLRSTAEVQVVATQDVMTTGRGNAHSPDWTAEEERVVRRKVDVRIFAMLGILLGLSLLDRVNVSAAYVAGMAQDLDLYIGSRYNIALLVFFIGYFLFEIPSNLLMRRFGTRSWLGGLVIGWGITCMCMGFVRTWSALVGLRAVLGVLEAGTLPGAIFIVGSWYRPYEVATRVSLLFLTSQLIAAFGPILAYGLSRISIDRGIFTAGWRWIFIIEGLASVVAGLLCLVFLIEFPGRAKFLTVREKRIASQRIRLAGEHEAIDESIKRTIFIVATDCRIILIAIIFFIAASSVYSLAYFTPIILRQGLGFSTTKALLLTTPPSLVSAMFTVGSATLSDKFRIRWPIIVFQALLGIIGLLIILYVEAAGVRYFGLFVASYGTQSNLQAVLIYLSNQVATERRRGIATGFAVSFGALGGICGSTIFRVHDAPKYLPGIWTTIALLVLLILITLGLTLHFRRLNKLVDRGRIKHLQGVAGFRHVL